MRSRESRSGCNRQTNLLSLTDRQTEHMPKTYTWDLWAYWSMSDCSSDIKSMENITISNNTFYLVICAFKGQCQCTTKIFCCRIQEQIILAWNFKLAGGFKVPSRFLLDKVKGVGRRENHTCPQPTFKRKFKTKHRAGGSSPLWWTAAVYRCAHNGNYCN